MMERNCNVFLLMFALLTVIGAAQGSKWTGWKDFDNPSGSGDYERISDHPTATSWRPCGGREIIWIHAKVKGQPISSGIMTRDNLDVGPKYGLYCSNGFIGGLCKDYAVKYYGIFPSSWKDIDDPSFQGGYYVDSELKTDVGPLPNFIRYIRIRAQGTANSYRVDQRIHLSPRYGFTCINSEQDGEQCKDYEVRYYCGGYPELGLRAAS